MKVLVGRHITAMQNFTGLRHCALSLVHPNDFAQTVSQLRANDSFRYIWTNNPYVVDCFELEEVFVLNAQNKLIPLTDNPTVAKWQGSMSAGEIWASLGDDWADTETVLG